MANKKACSLLGHLDGGVTMSEIGGPWTEYIHHNEDLTDDNPHMVYIFEQTGADIKDLAIAIKGVRKWAYKKQERINKMKAEIRIRDLSGCAIDAWLKDKSVLQRTMASKIFHAHKHLTYLADDSSSNESIKRICRMVLDYIEDIPDTFFRETFFGTMRSNLRAKMRLVKTNCAKLVALLDANGRDVEDSQRLLVSIFNKLHFVAEAILESSEGFEKKEE